MIDDQSLETFLRRRKVVLVTWFDARLEVEGGIKDDSQVVEFGLRGD